MKSDKQLDREIFKASEFVNSFPNYDPSNKAQALGFIILETLQWARGKRVDKPSARWPALREMDRLTKIITDTGMTAQEFARAYNGPEGDAAAAAIRSKR